MTNEKILNKAIEKAVNNAWSKDEYEMYMEFGLDTFTTFRMMFSHQFAKAFWGSTPMCSACERHHETFSDCDCGTGNDMKEWEVRLRQMVIKKDPIKYLEQFLEVDK